MKLFVWDFHGVLEKGNDLAVLEITNLSLKKHKYTRIMTTEEADILSGLRWYEYFAYLLPESTKKHQLELQATCFELSNSRPDILAKYLLLNDNASQVLHAIKEAEYPQILISNTRQESLDQFVKMVDIEEYFPKTHRFAADSHTQTKLTKKDCLKSFLQDKYFPEGIVSIGDSAGDMALIHDIENGIGYHYKHPGKKHLEIDCHYKIHCLTQVLNELSVGNRC
ncbi:hypothetical protein BN1013_01149 [Candidatus Rubidus massiliensis]|nr:hypothetical protein BN1013_01149 [Candidatus Rubidus massiliensis]